MAKLIEVQFGGVDSECYITFLPVKIRLPAIRKYSLTTCYPYMPIGKVWIYHLLLLFVCFVSLFVYFLCVCTVTDFSGEDKAIIVKFCSVVHRHPGHEISHYGELCYSRSPKSIQSARGDKYCR